MALPNTKIFLGAYETLITNVFTLCNSDKKKEDSEPEQIGGSETDLTAVLNAWYSAGFHTGK
jgi:hypothetical protein